MPTKKVVAVKSEADATLMASAPAVARKRTSAKAKPVTEAAAAEVAPVSGEKKARSSTKKTTTAAVTHRHKKQTQQESAAISNTAVSPVSAETKVAPVAPVLAFEPAGEDVARLAYSYYVARGYQAGDQAADWFRAINELKASHAAASYLLED